MRSGGVTVVSVEPSLHDRDVVVAGRVRERAGHDVRVRESAERVLVVLVEDEPVEALLRREEQLLE